MFWHEIFWLALNYLGGRCPFSKRTPCSYTYSVCSYCLPPLSSHTCNLTPRLLEKCKLLLLLTKTY